MTNKKTNPTTTKKQTKSNDEDDLKFLQDLARKNDLKQKKKESKEQKKAALWVSITEDGLVKKKVITPAAKEDAAVPTNGKTVTVHYVGTLKSTGAQFDSSRTRNEPFQFSLGAGQVIKGWEVALSSMKVGEKSIFELDSTYGYGARGAGASIPPNSTLVFEIELLSFN